MWGVQSFGVEPDILVTGKGLSGGVYPIAAAVLSPRVAGWLEEDGWAHVSTFGGAELGCPVALKVLEICTRSGVCENAATVAQRLGAGLRDIQSRCADWMIDIRQQGLVMGLKFAHPHGGMLMSKALYEEGIWAMFAGHEMSVLQFKPGLLLDAATCDETLERFERGVRRCRETLS